MAKIFATDLEGLCEDKSQLFQICFRYAPTHEVMLQRRNYARRVSVKTKDGSVSGCQHVIHYVVLF